VQLIFSDNLMPPNCAIRTFRMMMRSASRQEGRPSDQTRAFIDELLEKIV
jgi:hypothetical protein